MNNICFVVFPQGASGSFVAQILISLYDNIFTDIRLGEKNEAHNYQNWSSDRTTKHWHDVFLNEPVIGIPSLLSTINNHVGSTVITTHPSSSVAAYQKKWPGAKFVFIRPYSQTEWIICFVLGFLKWGLHTISPGGQDVIHRDRYVQLMLIAILPEYPNALSLIDKVSDPKYEDIFLWAHINYGYPGLANQNIFDLNLGTDEPRWLETPIRTNDIVLPYSCIVNNDIEQFVNTCVRCLGIDKLNQTQEEFVRYNFSNYHKKQNQELFSNVCSFAKNTEQRARKLLDELFTQ